MFLLKLNACRIRILVITPKNILCSGLKYSEKGHFRRSKCEALQKCGMNQCTFPLMRRYSIAGHTGPASITIFHAVVTADFTAQQQWLRAATGYCS